MIITLTKNKTYDIIYIQTKTQGKHNATTKFWSHSRHI